MLARADVASAVTPLGLRDLRGWHHVLTGGILGGLSPWRFDAGMTGRRGYLADSPGNRAGALARLRLVLEAAGTAPVAVALLPDRSSRILGTAAATLLGLPATDFDPGEPARHSLVIAYDLTATDPAAAAALHRFVETITAAEAGERDGGWLGAVREYIPTSAPCPAAASPELPRRSRPGPPAAHVTVTRTGSARCPFLLKRATPDSPGVADGRTSPAHQRPGCSLTATRRQGNDRSTAYDPVRTTTDIVSDDARTIPAGMRGAVPHAKPDGTCLTEFTFTLQTADTDGDFVQGVLTRRKDQLHAEELRVHAPQGQDASIAASRPWPW